MVKAKPLSHSWLPATLQPRNCWQYYFLFQSNMPEQAFPELGVGFHVDYVRRCYGTLQQIVKPLVIVRQISIQHSRHAHSYRRMR
jgi:hypothetical protein